MHKTVAYRLDPFDLRLFIAVLELGTITAAAEAMNLSLAAASARLKALDQRVGVPLLDRAKAGSTPTAAGRALAHHAQRVLGEVEALHTEMSRFGAGLRGTLRVAGNTAATALLLPALLGQFLVRHADIDLELQELPSEAVLEALHRRAVDLGLVADHVDTSGLHVQALGTDRLCAAVPARLSAGLAAKQSTRPKARPGTAPQARPGTAPQVRRGTGQAASLSTGQAALLSTGQAARLSTGLTPRGTGRQRSLRFADLMERPFVGLPADAGLSRFLQQVAARSGRVPRHRVRVRDLAAVLQLVDAGVGVAVVPAAAAQRFIGPSTKLLPLEDAWALRRLLVCVQPDMRDAPGVRDLLAFLATHALPVPPA